MPELNASIPPIECYVRGNFLRNQIDSHELKFPCVIFGVASIPDRAPVFHFLMEDGGVWWRAPINAFCATPDAPEVDLHDLVLWNSFSSHISVTIFEHMRGMSMTYINRHREEVDGKYMFTLDWHTPDINILDTGYSVNPGQHKCGHVIQRQDGNFAIQPNNRVKLWDPSYTTKKGQNLINRLVNETLWDVEDGDKWLTSDDDRYDYDIVAGKNTTSPTSPTNPTNPTSPTGNTEDVSTIVDNVFVVEHVDIEVPAMMPTVVPIVVPEMSPETHEEFYDSEKTNADYWKPTRLW